MVNKIQHKYSENSISKKGIVKLYYSAIKKNHILEVKEIIFQFS